MRRKGFTLIELLVVIAIIVILAGILFPAFAATRRAANNAACISNLKQVGMAVSMYSQDYDETFPRACDMTDRHPVIVKAQPDWPVRTPFLWEVAAPYVKNAGVWRCPGDIGFTSHTPFGLVDFRPNTYNHVIPGETNPCGSSYRYNTDLAWLPTGNPDQDPFERQGRWEPLTVGAIQKPADTFLVAEPAGQWHNAISGTQPTYHYNGVCIDGHAKGVTRAVATGNGPTDWGRTRDQF
jgi:prepilin-type N-terminal cleavage/methylation domain-containing protein